MDPNRLYDLMVWLMGQVVATFATAGVDLPERRYTSETTTAGGILECNQMTVSLERLSVGQPGRETPIAQNVQTRSADIAIEIVRCFPEVDPHDVMSTSDQEAMGKEAMVDAWLLSEAVISSIKEAKRSGTCLEMAHGPLVPLPTQGGLRGVQLRVIAQL